MKFTKLSPEEVASGQLAPETLAQAVLQVRLNGFVVLENALPVELVDRMRVAFLAAVDEALRVDASKTELNTSSFRKNRIRMDLPFREPFIDARVITNAFALPIVERILGEDCRMFYFSADAPMPGSDYQMAHGDYFPFYPESEVILPPTGLVVNYPLVNVNEKNGPLEVWPNTHLNPDRIYTGSQVQDAIKGIDPVRMLTPKGSLIIRDMRMWHRGTPNVSDEIRPNLALIYARNWWTGIGHAQLTLGITKPIFEGLSPRAKKLFRFEKLTV